MLKLKYYTWRHGADWEAICTDLDLAVQGTSLQEVREEIRNAIDTYLEYLSELPKDERDRLSKQKSPLSLRMSLRLQCWIFGLFSLRKNDALENSPVQMFQVAFNT